jgi:hypothetical protein
MIGLTGLAVALQSRTSTGDSNLTHEAASLKMALGSQLSPASDDNKGILMFYSNHSPFHKADI